MRVFAQLRLPAAAAAILLAGGCASLDSQFGAAPSPTETAVTQLQQQVTKLEDRIAGLQMEQTRLQQDMQALSQSAQQSGGAKTQIAELERRIQALDAAREADKKYIMDALPQKIAAQVNSQAPSSASSARNSGAVQEGYEHVVKPGETLSQIASAYKTSVSAILKANALKSANAIRPGQKLFIPEKR